MRPSTIFVRRAALLLATVLLTACGSDPVAPEAEAPSIARWAGSYTGQSRFGAMNGTWGNGGTYPLVIAPSGQVTVSGALLLEPVYDHATATLSWRMADGNATNGEVAFHETLESEFFFRDLANSTAGQGLTGYIQRPREGRLDYRGVLR
jgi:hypothetical protein